MDADKDGVTGPVDLQEMFNGLPIALYRTNAAGELLAANTALANLLGFETMEETRRHLSAVDDTYVNPRDRERWREEMEIHGTVFDFDIELKRADGSTIWVQDTARAVRDADGHITHYEGALVDMTDKMKVKKAKDEFLATVSHELRNPIAVILGMGEELANNYDSFADADRRDMATLIARQADDAAWLIEDLLVAYRDDVTRVPIALTEFDPVKAAERVLEVVEKPVEVEVRGGPVHVKADPRRTRQIIRNLVSNANRYGGDEILIRLEPVGDRVEIRVCDSGDPIDPTDAERIFKPFETGRMTHQGSVGLGLPVARKLARLMEGDLVYRRIDDMTSFVLSLPRA